MELARSAGLLTLGWFQREDLEVDDKADGTEVTAADRAAESLVKEYLAEHRPTDAVIGEEFGRTGGTSGLTWIVDPIDGTYGFVRGVPLYATLVAVVDADGPVVGVIDFPALDHRVFAGRGEGCWSGGSRCSVSTTEDLDGALVCASDWSLASEDQLVALRRSGVHMRTWGDAYGYAMVAAGRADAMVDPICSEWDLAPMGVILEEAGGRFTSLGGEPSHSAGSGVGTNGRIHELLLTRLTAGK